LEKFIPECLATGIGSLPHDSLKEGLDLIEKNLSAIPHWPQLPQWGEEEGFINQYIEPLIRLGMVTFRKDGTPYFDTQKEAWIEQITKFYEIYLEASSGNEEALEFFAFPEKGGAGFYGFSEYLKATSVKNAQYLKGQVSGPLTLALQLKDENRRSIYYNPDLRDLLVKTLAMMAKWQTRKLKEFGLPVLMFVDDPGLGSFGLSTYITLKKEDIIEDLNFIYAEIQAEKALAGTHSCAGIDWTLLMDSKVNIISFDAYNYYNSMKVFPQELNGFLNRGGVLAWGIVPTSEDIWQETVESLQAKLGEQINYLSERGLSNSKLFEQAIITPSCGTGTLERSTAERIYKLTNGLSRALREKGGF